MRGTLTLAGALLAISATPLAAQPDPEERAAVTAAVTAAVIGAANAFFAALRSPDKTALDECETLDAPGGQGQ
jgi:hypothetical protein